MRLRHPNTFFTVALICFGASILGCEDSEKQRLELIKTDDLPILPSAITVADLPRTTPAQPKNLTLAVVGEVRGELEPCGCPTLPFGGFERRNSLLQKLATDGPGPVFHVDAGDMLIKGFSTSRADDVKTRARELLKMSQLVGVDAWVPGTSDLMALTLTELKQVQGPPAISATWKNSNGDTVFPATIILNKGDVRVAVVGISAPPPTDQGIFFEEPAQAIEDAVRELPDSVDWVIGVGNIDDEEAKTLMADVTGLSALFTTKGAVYVDPPEDNTNRPIIETPDRGRYVQVVHARLGTSANEPLLIHPDKAAWRARLSAVRNQQPDALLETGAGRNLALINTIPLSAELDQTGVISTRLENYQEDRRQLAAKRAEEVQPHEKSYASSGACVNCHASEFARWTLTSHAKSWHSLLKREATNNPECVSCHTTGFGEPGGLGELTPKNIRKFKGVQCEECHGPLKGHPSDDRVHAEPVNEQTCLKCHDEANSPNFDYATYLPKATCQGGAPSVLPSPPTEP